MSEKVYRRAAVWGGAAVVALVLAMSVDYAIARFRAPRDEARVEQMQKQVREDYAKAPELEKEKKRITDALLARKVRINVFAMLLVAASAAFLYGAKKLVPSQVVKTVKTAPKPEPTHRCKLHDRPPVPGYDPAFIDALVAREGRTTEAAIPILQAIQEHYRYLPDEALRYVCEITDITPAQIAGTSSFYSRFRRSPVGDHLVRVCHGTACHVSGARQITDELRRSLNIPEGADTDPEGRFTIEEVACLGCCSLAPVMMVDEQTVGKLTPAAASEALGAARPVEPV